MPTIGSLTDILDFVDDLARLNSISELRDHLQAAAQACGFNSFILTGIVPVMKDENLHDLIVLSTLPQQFVDEYSAKNYLIVDPLIQKTLNSAMPFDWHNFVDDSTSKAERGLVSLRQDVGIERVRVFPLHAPKGYEACFAVTGSEPMVSSQESAALHLLGFYALIRARIFSGLPQKKSYELSGREIEVLKWSALGKSAWEIGEILNISKRTVDEYSQTIFRKLHATNRTHAVAIALHAHLIDL